MPDYLTNLKYKNDLITTIYCSHQHNIRSASIKQKHKLHSLQSLSQHEIPKSIHDSPCSNQQSSLSLHSPCLWHLQEKIGRVHSSGQATPSFALPAYARRRYQTGNAFPYMGASLLLITFNLHVEVCTILSPNLVTWI